MCDHQKRIEACHSADAGRYETQLGVHVLLHVLTRDAGGVRSCVKNRELTCSNCAYDARPPTVGPEDRSVREHRRVAACTICLVSVTLAMLR